MVNIYTDFHLINMCSIMATLDLPTPPASLPSSPSSLTSPSSSLPLSSVPSTRPSVPSLSIVMPVTASTLSSRVLPSTSTSALPSSTTENDGKEINSFAHGICVCYCTDMFVCVYVCTCVYVYVCICMCVYACVCNSLVCSEIICM